MIKIGIVIDLLMFTLAFLSLSWIMKKMGIPEKLFKKARQVKAYNFILVFIFFIFMFLLECGKRNLYDFYGKKSWISIVFAGFLSAIYLNSIPYIFKANK